MPVATGAAVACPDRKVLNLEADGSAMYTLQSLWTQAREGLDVTTSSSTTASYAILNLELSRVGARTDGNAADLFDLSRPPLDFVALARGMGVDAVRAETADELVRRARARARRARPAPDRRDPARPACRGVTHAAPVQPHGADVPAGRARRPTPGATSARSTARCSAGPASTSSCSTRRNFLLDRRPTSRSTSSCWPRPTSTCESPGYDHLGVLCDTREEVDELLERAKRWRDKDDRVKIIEFEKDLVQGPVTVHAFYVQYLLPDPVRRPGASSTPPAAEPEKTLAVRLTSSMRRERSEFAALTDASQGVYGSRRLTSPNSCQR